MRKYDKWDCVLLGVWAVSIVMVFISGRFVHEVLISKTFMFWMALAGGLFVGRNLLDKNKIPEK